MEEMVGGERHVDSGIARSAGDRWQTSENASAALKSMSTRANILMYSKDRWP
jgi:hypothetical protein